jgi:hypothetical protein
MNKFFSKIRKDTISDEYCVTTLADKIRELKNVQVPDENIIKAFNRAILWMQHDEWQKRERK